MTTETSRSLKNVGIVIFPGFDELDAVAPYEVLRKASAGGAALAVELVALRGAGPVTGSQGMTVLATAGLEKHFDWLVVAGGAWAARGEIGAWGEIQRGDLPRALARCRQEGTAFASVCTGTMLLSAAGLTRGRPAITHHVAIDALREQGAEIVAARVVDDGDLLTAGGVTSGLDLALWFVERHHGAPLAEKIAHDMEYTRVGPVWRASLGGRV
jgi:transcriptional regulator GlxA family with amidase domain